jgi:hypothetical protein
MGLANARHQFEKATNFWLHALARFPDEAMEI